MRVHADEIALFLRDSAGRYGKCWRKSARTPGAERELAAVAADRLHCLGLLACDDDGVEVLRAIARFALGQTQVRNAADTTSLFPPATDP